MINQINAKQLFLLCALRKGKVRAKNLEVYSWTIRHDHELIEKANMILKDKTKVYKEVMDSVREELKDKFPIQDSCFRNFIVYDGQMGCDLTDYEEDMAWYSDTGHGWAYGGMFEIEQPLSRREEYFLFPFLEISRPRSVLN